jgi:hypothetical protein
MATMTTPQLTIVGSQVPGFSTLTVKYTVTFSAFDQASGQPYRESIDVIGDDTAVGDPATAGADDALYTIVNVVVVSPPAAVQARTHTITLSNSTLNEDTGAIPNPDEIRARVTLTPIAPTAIGPIESNLVALQLS